MNIKQTWLIGTTGQIQQRYKRDQIRHVRPLVDLLCMFNTVVKDMQVHDEGGRGQELTALKRLHQNKTCNAIHVIDRFLSF